MRFRSISHRQQCHLAFISEFNVQLLYLPGLKNVVAVFFPAPSPPTNHWNSRRHSSGRSSGLEEMAAEQNRCAETQRLLGGTSLKLAFRQTGAALNAWLVTFLLASSDQLFLKYSGKIFSHIFTMLLIPGGSPPVVLFHPGLCGTDYPATSLPGSVSIWPASGARFTATHA
jgi:hypothetical protein